MLKKILLISLGLVTVLILLATIYQTASMATPTNNDGIKTLHFDKKAIKIDFFKKLF